MANNVDVTIRGRNEAGAAIAAAQRQITALRGVVSQLAAGFGLGLGAGVFQQLASGIAGAVRSGIAYNAVLETNTVAFKSLLGSASAAAQRMEDLADFAASTPFELPQVVQASRLLQSLTDGALAGGDALRLVGDAASASGRGFEEAAMWIGRLYAGLQSGTPVGEATMRLLEMGLVSGDTKRHLDALAESGEATGRGMQIVRETFAKTTGAMAEQSKTAAGLRSTLNDTLKALAADAVLPAWEKLQDVMRGILETLGAMPSAAEALAAASVGAQAAIVARVGQSTTEPARQTNLADLRRQREEASAALETARASLTAIEAARQKANSAPAWSAGAIAELRKLTAEEAIVRAQEEALVREINAADVAVRRLESAAAKAKALTGTEEEAKAKSSAYVAPNEEDLLYAKLDLQRANEAILEQEARFAATESEDDFWRKQEIEDYHRLNQLLAQQTREKERAVEVDAEERRRREQRAFEGSYVGGTFGRYQQWQESEAVDNQAGVGGGMLAGMQETIMQLGTAAQNAGAIVSNTLGAAFSTIGDQITKLILGTVTWGQALANIGRSILAQLVQSIVQFFVNLIARQILTAVIGTAIASSQAAAMSAAWAGPAVLASIASYGAAAELGPAAVTAALASAPAIAAAGAAAGYASGGYTGDGPIDQVAGLVHRGEYVIPADAVSRLGIRNLEAMTTGSGSGAGTASVARGAADSRAIRIYNFMDRAAMNAQLRDDLDGIMATVLARYS